MKTLFLGLGNPILTDDGVGIRIAKEIGEKCKNVDVAEASAAGFRIIDEIIGYDRLIIIDSIKTGKARPGTLHKFLVNDFAKTLHLSTPHDISLFEAFKVVRKENVKLPSQIEIYAMEVEDTSTFSEKCTELVESAIPKTVQQIMKEQNLT
ncbi:MAG: hydrogenase maturation protease [Candidatus Cloacimonadota bacterium]|nr:hydrogenase maturation protease [Candidatus Cloacimonadota bacterium]